jgi:hypothetical protein
LVFFFLPMIYLAYEMVLILFCCCSEIILTITVKGKVVPDLNLIKHYAMKMHGVGPRASLNDMEKKTFLILTGPDLRSYYSHPARNQLLYRLHCPSSI